MISELVRQALLIHLRSKLKEMQILPGEKFGVDWVAVKGQVAQHLVASLVLPDFTGKFYESDRLPIPEGSIPPPGKVAGTLFVFNTEGRYAYSISFKTIRESDFADLPTGKVFLVKATEASKYIDFSGFIRHHLSGFTVPH